MEQIHKRFATEQLKALLEGFCRGTLDRPTIEEILGIGRSRFFVLLNRYRHDPSKFSLNYDRNTPARLSASAEREIERQLELEKGLIEDPGLPITIDEVRAVLKHEVNRYNNHQVHSTTGEIRSLGGGGLGTHK